jgi:hypothetical protein
MIKKAEPTRKAAIIEDSIVTNVIVIPFGDEGDLQLSKINAVECSGIDMGIGWSFDGTDYTAPPKTDEELEAIQLRQAKQEKITSATEKLKQLGLNESEIAAMFNV